MWILFVFKYNKLQGELFVFGMFAIDAIFDSFFSIFPIFLLNKSSTFTIIVGSLNTASTITFVASFVPMIWLAWKLWEILDFLSILGEKEFKITFRRAKFFGYTSKSKKRNSNKINKSVPNRGNLRLTIVETAETGPPSIQLAQHTAPLQTAPNNDKKLYISKEVEASSQQNGTHTWPGPVVLSRTLSIESNASELDAVAIQPIDTVETETMREFDSDENNLPDREDSLLCCNENDCNVCPTKIKYGCNICCYGPKCLNKLPFYEDNEDEFLIQFCRRFCLVFVAIIWFAYAIYIITTTLYHFNVKTAICENYSANKILTMIENDVSNPFDAEYAQLFVWDKCIYKVYPISDNIPCNCRGLYIFEPYDEGSTFWEFGGNISTSDGISMVVDATFREFYMLESVYFYTGTVGEFTSNFTDEHMKQSHMKLVSLVLRILFYFFLPFVF